MLQRLGLDQPPTVQVMPANQVRFTFDKTKASAYFKSTGHPEVSLPDKFDGATLVVSIPSAAVLQYGTSSARDALIIGEAGELVVDVQGNVSLDELRDFLLGLPGLPGNHGQPAAPDQELERHAADPRADRQSQLAVRPTSTAIRACCSTTTRVWAAPRSGTRAATCTAWPARSRRPT